MTKKFELRKYSATHFVIMFGNCVWITFEGAWAAQDADEFLYQYAR